MPGMLAILSVLQKYVYCDRCRTTSGIVERSIERGFLTKLDTLRNLFYLESSCCEFDRQADNEYTIYMNLIVVQRAIIRHYLLTGLGLSVEVI